MLRRIRRAIHFIIYHAYVKKKISADDRTSLFGLSLTVPKTVFHPSLYLTSRFLASYLDGRDFTKKKGLEIGSGSGLLSLIAARRGALMIALDINPAAVASTMENAKRNGLESRVIPVCSDLFAGLSPLHRDFDFILCNPPYYKGEAANDSEKAWHGGEDHEFLRRLASEASGYLRPGGTVTFILSTDAAVDEIMGFFHDARYQTTIVAQKHLLFEDLIIFEASHL